MAAQTITGADVYDLMTSRAMDPVLVRCTENGAVDARSARYAEDFPDQYEVIISRDDALLIDQSGDYTDEGEPSDEWCAMVAEVLNSGA